MTRVPPRVDVYGTLEVTPEMMAASAAEEEIGKTSFVRVVVPMWFFYESIRIYNQANKLVGEIPASQPIAVDDRRKR